MKSLVIMSVLHVGINRERQLLKKILIQDLNLTQYQIKIFLLRQIKFICFFNLFLSRVKINANFFDRLSQLVKVIYSLNSLYVKLFDLY